ncbi:hypothetical protein GCM10022254_52510 [Actinomadura meridiana]|uniref:RNA polymerase sigma-70 region 2 domain-containing protein n=1 Tax=Actinomadura meridiana TaxID=559626 RepID=A0ABP8CE40_9ACTN
MSAPQADGTPDLTSWIKENHRYMLRVAFMMSRDPWLAEDITQEACLKIFRAWQNKQQRDLILTSRGYVFNIVRNTFLNHWKTRSRINHHEVPPGPEYDEVFRDSDTKLRDLIFDLPEDERALLIFHYHFRMHILDAGRQLGISKHGAYRLRDRAHNSLRALLQDQED